MGFYRNSRSAYFKAEKAVKKALFFPMKSSGMDKTDSVSGESQDNKFVFTDMDEFVLVQFDEGMLVCFHFFTMIPRVTCLHY